MFSRLFLWYAERPKKMVQNFSSWEEKVRSANDDSLCWEAPVLAFYSCKKSGRKSFVLSTLRSPLIPVYQDMLAHYQTYPRQTGFLAAINGETIGTDLVGDFANALAAAFNPSGPKAPWQNSDNCLIAFHTHDRVRSFHYLLPTFIC